MALLLKLCKFINWKARINCGHFVYTRRLLHLEPCSTGIPMAMVSFLYNKLPIGSRIFNIDPRHDPICPSCNHVKEDDIHCSNALAPPPPFRWLNLLKASSQIRVILIHTQGHVKSSRTHLLTVNFSTPHLCWHHTFTPPSSAPRAASAGTILFAADNPSIGNPCRSST